MITPVPNEYPTVTFTSPLALTDADISAKEGFSSTLYTAPVGDSFLTVPALPS